MQVWSKPRLLALASYTSALYAAVLIPFKYGLPLVPGATEVRPGIAVLLLCSFLFGPPAAWGGAFGNLIGDFFGGTLGAGSLFGMPANFLYAYIPYKLWEITGGKAAWGKRNLSWWARFILVCWVSSAVCAGIIAWGIELVFHVPVMLLGGIIFTNNFILPIVLTPILLNLLAPRLRKWGLTYEQMEGVTTNPTAFAKVGALLLSLCALPAGLVMIVGFATLFLPSMGLYQVEKFPSLKNLYDIFSASVLTGGGYSRAIAMMSVFVFLFVISSILIGKERTGKKACEQPEAKEPIESPFTVRDENTLALLKDVTFYYADAEFSALSQVNFAAKRGEFVVIMGRTGAGKTTLLRCITGAIPNFYPGRFSGYATLFGVRSSDNGPSGNSHLAGMVFQDFESQLFSTNVELEVAFGAENLGLPRETIQSAVRNSLEMVGLNGFENRNPATLSGGEKQRLAIASVLAMNQPLLLLDEPSTDLDPMGKEEIFKVLARLKDQKRSVVLVENDIEAVRKADRVVMMKEGKISWEGSSEEALRQFDLLTEHGIKPPDTVSLFKMLGLENPPLDIEEAVNVLKERGKCPSEEKYNVMLQRERETSAERGAIIYEIADLHHEYEKQSEVLKGVNLTIRKGEMIAILGKNGSGKTTLAKHLNGLLKPSKGKVLFKGAPITSRPLSETAKEIGLVFQNPDHQVFSATVQDEVSFAPKNFGLSEEETKKRVQTAIKATRLEGYEDKDPFHLTKGERQRVAVASVLAGQPEVLIMDEPTTGLDIDEQKKIMELLVELNQQGHTIIIITHAVHIAMEYAKRTVLMADGRIIADAPTRQVFTMSEKLEEAGVREPDITKLSKKFGKVFLTVEEFVQCV